MSDYMNNTWIALLLFALVTILTFSILSKKSKTKAQLAAEKGKLSPDEVTKHYLDSGLEFGSAVSDLALGQCIGFETLHQAWSYWEKQYAQLGYRTISIDAFEGCAGWGHSIDELMTQNRDEDEEIVLHAELYRMFFLNQLGPALDTKKLMTDGQPQYGTYYVPTTEGLLKALHSVRERTPSYQGFSLMQVAEALRVKEETKQ